MLTNDAPFFTFVWFIGTVEGRRDPLKLGRVRVRCQGFHNSDKTLTPTDQLPWAEVVNSITSASVSGIGMSPNGLIPGSQVIGFFKDGKLAQQPVILGTIGGIPQEKNAGEGFNDPDGLYPRELDVPDTNALARGEDAASSHPLLVSQRATKVDNVPSAVRQQSPLIPDSGSYEQPTWSQPEPRYGGNTIAGRRSTYPFNHVYESESGHVAEFDDTPGAERIHLGHRSGTSQEIQADGTSVQRICASRYTIIAQDENVFISGSCNVTIAGDCRLLVKGDLVENIEGDHHRYIGGNVVENIKGSFAQQVMTDRSVSVAGEDNIAIGKNQNIKVSFDKTETIGGKENRVINDDSVTMGAGDVSVFAVGDIAVGASGGLAVGAGDVLEIASASGTTLKGSAVSVEGPVDMNSTLHVDGAVDLDSTLHADGTIDTDGSVTADGGVTAQGAVESITAIKRNGVTLTVP